MGAREPGEGQCPGGGAGAGGGGGGPDLAIRAAVCTPPSSLSRDNFRLTDFHHLYFGVTLRIIATVGQAVGSLFEQPPVTPRTPACSGPSLP